MTVVEAGARQPRDESRWAAALHLMTLSAVAVAQPLFDLFGDNAQFFVARGSEPMDIVTFAVLLMVVPPLLLLGVEALAGLWGARGRHVAHLVAVGLLCAVIALPLTRRASEATAVVVGLAVIAGAVGTYLYADTRLVRRALTWSAPVPLLLVAMFLYGSPVSTLLVRGDGGQYLGQPVGTRTPVVVVVFDEFASPVLMGADHRIDSRRFPGFARLAGMSTWFRNATTVSDYTHLAVPAIQSGMQPDRDLLPTVRDHPNNLFTLLSGTYRMNVHEAITDLCPTALCGTESDRPGFASRMRSLAQDSGVVYGRAVLPDRWADRLPSVADSWGNFLEQGEDPKSAAADFAQNKTRRETQEQGQRFTDFIASISADAGRPSLNFLHVLLPHVPWRRLPSGVTYPIPPKVPGLTGKESGGGVWVAQEYPTTLALQRYLLQTQYVDAQISRLLDRLQEVGMLDEALVVVTADHGVSFTPTTPRRTLTPRNAAEIMPVPLFVKLPGQRDGTTSDRNVESVDVLPTIADGLGITLPYRSDGASALTAAGERPTKVVRSATGGTLTRPAAFPDRYALADRIARTFRHRPRDDIYAFGPDADLVGRPLSELPLASSPAGSVQVDSADRYAAVARAGGTVPAEITGTVRGLIGDVRLAVALNGVVAAVGRPWEPAADGGRFAFLLPERLFRDGRNDVLVFAVTAEAGGARRLLVLAG